MYIYIYIYIYTFQLCPVLREKQSTKRPNTVPQSPSSNTRRQNNRKPENRKTKANRDQYRQNGKTEPDRTGLNRGRGKKVEFSYNSPGPKSAMTTTTTTSTTTATTASETGHDKITARPLGVSYAPHIETASDRSEKGR